MFGRIRQATLLYLLILVAGTAWLAQERKRSWEEPLWVSVYPINGDQRTATTRYVDQLSDENFHAVVAYLEAQAQRHGLEVPDPARINLGPIIQSLPPSLEDVNSPLDAMIWSLETRWWAMRATWDIEGPTPDIKIFAVYFDGKHTPTLHRSAGLEKGHVAVANLFADRSMRGSNQVVLTHELLHTLGATDKYDPANNQPLFPVGYAQPYREPLFPQRWAEIMAGRIPESPEEASIPPDLKRTIIGEATAREIGWLP